LEIRKLVKMANSIGGFFAADPDREVVLEGIAGHLKRFWEPRMRRQLIEWVDGGGTDGIDPIVLEAIRSRREQLMPKA
jgi:formate dehydrogenase subunit delta